MMNTTSVPLLSVPLWPRMLVPASGEAAVQDIWGVWSNSSLLLLPGPLKPRVVVPIHVPFMCQIDQFKNHLYKIGILVAVYKLFVLRIVTWKHIIAYKLLVLDRNTWNHITVCRSDKNTYYITVYKQIIIDIKREILTIRSCRVFANGPGDQGFNLKLNHIKDLKNDSWYLLI